MELSDYRRQIDDIDSQLLALFYRRMDVAAQIGGYKKAHNLPALDAGRERAKLQQIANSAPEALRDYTVSLYSLIFELSRSCQNRLLGITSPLTAEIEHAIAHTPPLFPEHPAVACQGVEGAYSQLACDRLFTLPNVFYCATFDAVFSAIEKGLCRYGVIPVENSTAGSVNAVYDLMMRHNFRIVRSVRLKIDHCLLARPGAQLSDIKEIYSHEQAISQCSRFLQGLPGVTVVRCENTAAAAKRVAESGCTDVAALASRACIGLYGLESLAASVQDQGNNYTRFVVISREPRVYPGANRTSLMITTANEPGALYRVLERFYALNINLIKLESRPIPGHDFEFMFYFDLDCPFGSRALDDLLDSIDDVCESFTYFGSYTEVL